MNWANRVYHPSGTQPLSQVQAAAWNLADLFGVPPNGKARVVFQAVADVAQQGAGDRSPVSIPLPQAQGGQARAGSRRRRCAAEPP